MRFYLWRSGLSLALENTGEREGCEVIQVYVRDLDASLVRPSERTEGL